MKKFIGVFSVALLVAAAVSAGEETVKASRFGFEKNDATKCLQAALDSGASTVIIDNTGSEWLSQQIRINRDNLTILFDEGVKVRALPGAFPNKLDAFFLVSDRKNVSFIGGKDSLVTMNKEEYRKIDARFQGGHRHAFRCVNADGITFKGMTITSSGGDGIYVGHGSRNITIKDTSCLDHARQGISVISCENLLIRNCHFDNTNGTPPQAGIDFEPNSNNEELINCVVESSTFNHNAGSGIALYLPNLDGSSPPISITIRDCESIGNANGVMITPKRTEGNLLRGFIKLENCRIAESEKVSMRITDPGKDLAFTMTGCTIDNSGNEFDPITVTTGTVLSPPIGNVTIKNTNVIDDVAGRPPILFKPVFNCGVAEDIDVEISLNGKPYDVKPALAKIPAASGPRPILSREKADNLVAPVVKGEVVNPKQRLNLRGKHKLLLLAKKGDQLNLWLQANPLSKRTPPAELTARLRNPKKKTVQQWKILSDGMEHTFSILAETAGMHTLEIDTRGQLVNLWSDHPGQGFLVSPDLAMLSPKCRYYFEVPAGVTDTSILLCGQSAVEIISQVALIDSTRKVVQSEKDTEAAILQIKRPADAPAEIWCLDIGKTKEDCYILMGEKLKPVVSGSPQLLLRSKS